MEPELEFGPDMTPAEFEVVCHLPDTLRLRTRTAGGSGDQGADVIAKKSERWAVIQYKLDQVRSATRRRQGPMRP